MNKKPIEVAMRILVNGVEIYYEVDGKGPPFILLHGNGEDHTIFGRLVEDLRENYAVYSIDTRGHGKSGKVDSYHYSDMAEDIASLIRELGLERPILYGFSDGGIIGLMLASKYPEMLSALIASGPNLSPRGLKTYVRIGMRLLYFFKRDPLFALMINEPDITDDDLKKISVPALITVAQKDFIVFSHAEHISKTIPHGELILVPYENHFSYVINSDRLFPLISDFIESVAKKP
jgi:pimeloyl-ACP methyl ester carboxylesterase